GAVWYSQRAEIHTIAEGEIKAMRQDPAAWQLQERDASYLFRDLDAQGVAAVGLTPGSVLVSARAGAKYYVADASGVLPRALYQRLDDKQDFELAVVDGR